MKITLIILTMLWAAAPGVRGVLRESGIARASPGEDHHRAGSGGGSVYASRRPARPLPDRARVLPRGGDPDAVQRFRHQGGVLAAHHGLEPQVAGGRQRRMGRNDQLRGAGRGRPRRIRHRVHRHRTLHAGRRVRGRASRKADRLLLALRARDDGEGEGDRAGVLRHRARAARIGTGAPPAAGRRSRKRRCFRTISTASSRARREIGPPWGCGSRTRC